MVDDLSRNPTIGKSDVADWRCGCAVLDHGLRKNSVAGLEAANEVDHHLLPAHFSHNCGHPRWNGGAIATSTARP